MSDGEKGFATVPGAFPPPSTSGSVVDRMLEPSCCAVEDVAERLAPLFKRLQEANQERNALARRLFGLGEDVPVDWLGAAVDPIGVWVEAKEFAAAIIDAVEGRGDTREDTE